VTANKSDPPAAPKAPFEARVDPEIRVGAAPVGRETFAAIAGELATANPGSAPAIVLETKPAGRETLSAISREVAPMRPPLATLPYGDLVPNAPGSIAPFDQDGDDETTLPRSAKPAATDAAQPEQADIFELLTFLVRCADPSLLASEEARRSFVAQRLRHRLPGADTAAITRIDVTPWTERDTVVVRIWYQVGHPGPTSSVQ